MGSGVNMNFKGRRGMTRLNRMFVEKLKLDD
jgi:hypothetical protein